MKHRYVLADTPLLGGGIHIAVISMPGLSLDNDTNRRA
jgi:hypothetical protein